MSNVIVAGSSGFIGKNMSAFLEKKGHNVVRLNSKNCNLLSDQSLLAFNNQKYDLIFNFSAWTQAGDFCGLYGGDQWIINNKMNLNLLEWWKNHQPQAKMISFGTSVSYTVSENLTESVYMTGEPYEKYYAYAYSKRELLVGLRSLAKQYGLKYLYLIPSTVYGPHYHTDGRELHFIYDLIRKIILGKTKGKDVVLWGDGSQKRELIYIDDFVEIAYRLSLQLDNEVVNLGTGDENSISEFSKIICAYVGFPFDKIQYDTSQFVGAKSKILNIDKLKSVVKDIEFTPVSKGLESTIEWMKNDGRSILENYH